MTHFHAYQQDAMLTEGTKDSDFDWRLTVAALGLAGESGEFVDHVKKVVAHGHELDDDALSEMHEELGDILWYIALACEVLGFSLEFVALENIYKLRKRYPDGFSTERSVNRDE